MLNTGFRSVFAAWVLVQSPVHVLNWGTFAVSQFRALFTWGLLEPRLELATLTYPWLNSELRCDAPDYSTSSIYPGPVRL